VTRFATINANSNDVTPSVRKNMVNLLVIFIFVTVYTVSAVATCLNGSG